MTDRGAAKGPRPSPESIIPTAWRPYPLTGLMPDEARARWAVGKLGLPLRLEHAMGRLTLTARLQMP